MKEFRTELIPAVSASPMGLQDAIFTIGSCFAETIGDRLAENKLKVWSNQFGTIYNPQAIHRLLLFGLENKIPLPESYLQQDGIHFNYNFHSSLSSLNRPELEKKINASVVTANGFLKKSNWIIITYGTAFVYRLKSSNEIVANCHRVPSANFSKSLLYDSEIVESFQKFYEQLKAVNPECKIILTVSPVRHLKDALELNAVSKSILRLASHSIVNQFTGVSYFPAYEILLDDLRDYRFYKTDRLHPTEEAIEYILEKFMDAYFDETAKQFINAWKEIKKGLNHKPFHPHSANHQKFLKATLGQLEKLNATMDFSEEILSLRSRITNPGHG